MSLEIVLLGGNGYIGREVTRQWLAHDLTAHFTVVSRSGKNTFASTRVSNVAADVTDADALLKALPNKVDCIVCLVGGLGGADANVAPVQSMLKVAKSLKVPAVGYVGGKMGDNSFVAAKALACKMVRASGIRAVIVEPTLVYGAGRSDKFAKMVPLLKFAGLFNKNVRPVKVEDVASQLVNGLA